MLPGEILSAFLLLLLAEFGDKTQLLSMTLAARYGFRTVAGAVLVATALLQLAAVILGKAMGSLLSGRTVSLAAGLIFILFGIYMLLEKEDNEEEEAVAMTAGTGSRKGGFAAVAGIFLLAELGDKTQLATVAMAGKSASMWSVWLGATLGMYAANLIGIVVGDRLKGTLRPEYVKKGGGVVFILFGLASLFVLMRG